MPIASITEDELRSWGLSGEPLNWVPDAIRTSVGVIRQSNLNPADAALRSAAELAIAAISPDFVPGNVLLSTAPVGTFVIDVDGMTAVATFDDFPLGLPAANVHWDFGDRTGPIFQSTETIEHVYASIGSYTVNLSVAVAGVVFQSQQTVYAPGDEEPPPPVIPTGVTEGAPGSFTPAGSQVPADLAALTALGALGQTTVWAEGNHVILGDASVAHWNATAWTLGVAPPPAGDPDPDPDPAKYDPGEHTVQEVKDFVNGLENEGHGNKITQKILNRERKGQDRQTLVDWLDRKLGAV